LWLRHMLLLMVLRLLFLVAETHVIADGAQATVSCG
jgi:hypothetical protein